MFHVIIDVDWTVKRVIQHKNRTNICVDVNAKKSIETACVQRLFTES